MIKMLLKFAVILFRLMHITSRFQTKYNDEVYTIKMTKTQNVKDLT